MTLWLDANDVNGDGLSESAPISHLWEDKRRFLFGPIVQEVITLYLRRSVINSLFIISQVE